MTVIEYTEERERERGSKGEREREREGGREGGTREFNSVADSFFSPMQRAQRSAKLVEWKERERRRENGCIGDESNLQ